MVEASFAVTDKNKTPIENAIIKIGDLTVKTSKDGSAKIVLFPAVYDITIEKTDFYTLNSQLEISGANNQFNFELDSRFTSINFKVLDSTSESGIAANFKIENQQKQITFFNSDNAGNAAVPIEKNSSCSIEISSSKYKSQSLKIDSSKLSPSSLTVKLDREEFGFKLKPNVNSGTYNIKNSESGKNFSGSFSEGVIALLIPFGKYEVTVSSENYKPFQKSFEILSTYEENINLEPNFKSFSFFVTNLDKSGVTFNQEVPKDFIALKNSSVTLLKNKVPFYTVKNMGAPINISYGTYDIAVSADFTESAVIEGVKFEPTSQQVVIVTSKETSSFVSGSVKSGDTLLGGALVIFSDDNGNSYSVTSAVDGSYSIKVPPRIYDIKVQKEGYKLANGIALIRSEKYISTGVYLQNFSLDEIQSIITGKVTTLSGTLVAKAKITVKLDKSEAVFYSENDGSYKISSNSGLLFIKVEKPGLKSKGTVKMLNKYSTLSGLDFKLEEILSSIEGNISDNSSPLGNIQLQLIDENKKIVTSLISKNDGSYKFENLPSFKKYSILIENVNYFKFVSKEIELGTSPVTNFNILLNKNSTPVILEIRNSQNTPVSNLEVFINGVSYKSDINGFVEALIKIDESASKIDISIPSASFSDSLEIKKNFVPPLKKSIQLNIK